MSKSPWVGVGTWAAEAEREEAEEREQQAAAAAAASSGNRDSQAFPSLKEAASTKPKKKKMSLSEFYSAGPGSGSTRTVGLTPDEMLQLPTGPKQRSDDDFYSGGRGGFSNYGRSGAPPGRMRERDADADGSWGSRRSYGGFDDDRRGPPPRRTSDFDSPSRADEVDNWAAGKRPQHAPMMDAGAGGRTNRYGSLGGGSRADEVDSWTSGKRFTQPPPLPSRSNTFGSGFRDSDDSDRWRRGDARETDMVRPRLVLDPRKGESAANETAAVVKTNKPNPFGAARPREEILAEKGLDWKKLDSDIEAKKTTSRPTSSQGSRPSSAHSSRSENVVFGQQGQGMGLEVPVKPRPKVNPFGDAKPREVLLEEKGKDWRKIDLDLEHRAVDRPETEEEKALKEEIDHLKKQLEKEPAIDVPQVPGGDQTSLPDVIRLKERDLETLIRELDDKVRFGQKAVERPGSGAGKFTGFPERPPSQSGRSEDGRNMEFMDRPRSRGTGNAWPRTADERRVGFQGSRDKGFLGSRDYGRSRSRERW